MCACVCMRVRRCDVYLGIHVTMGGLANIALSSLHHVFTVPLPPFLGCTPQDHITHCHPLSVHSHLHLAVAWIEHVHSQPTRILSLHGRAGGQLSGWLRVDVTASWSCLEEEEEEDDDGL